MDPAYPRFYAVNDRPVKLVLLPNGGSDCLVFDFDTGGFSPDRSYFAHLIPGSGKDVDQLTAAEFERLVAQSRAQASQLRREAAITWRLSVGPGPGYQAQHRGRSYLVRLNPPDQRPYTLFVDGQQVEDLGTWPPAWVKAGEPEPSTARVMATGPGVEAAVLRKWSDQLCRAASSEPEAIAAALGLAGTLVDHGDCRSVEPPPVGTARVRLIQHPAGFDYVEVAFSGSGPTRAQIDAQFGESAFVPRLHPGSAHKLAYYVEAPGAPFKCAVFAGFDEQPAPAAVARSMMFRRDRAS